MWKIVSRAVNNEGGKERRYDMKGKNDQPPLLPPVVEDEATERLKKRLRDLGLIVNAGDGKPAKPTGKKKGDKK
jgi:hypothetical protein